MIRSFILGLSLVFFVMSAFVTFKAVVSPVEYSGDYPLSESPITFIPPPISDTSTLHSSGDGEQTFITELAGDKTYLEDLPSASVQNETQHAAIEAAPESAQPIISHELPKTLAVFDGKTFRSGQDIIQNIEPSVIEKMIQEMSSSPDSRISIEGHTDNAPTLRTGGNMDLSLQRAKSIANILISRGIPADRISIQGFGDTRPIDTNKTEEGRLRNRRVEVMLTSK